MEQKTCALWRYGEEGFVKVKENPIRSDLKSSDVFLLDCLDRTVSPTLFVWVGGQTTGEVRRRAIQVGQDYLTEHRRNSRSASIMRVNEGREGRAFSDALAQAALSA
jgi:hypothetical protein